MEHGQEIATKDASGFRSKRVQISERDGITITPVGDEMSFKEMMSYRKPATPEAIRQGLDGEGYLFANIGISALLTTTFEGKNYVLLVKQDRPDFGDSVAKLLSGYLDAKHQQVPDEAMEQEVGEEFLPVGADGKILAGLRNFKPLPRPYEGTLPYATRFGYQVFELDNELFVPQGMSARANVGDSKPRLYYHANMNSAQLVYPWHVDVPGMPSLMYAEANHLHESTLNHSEDKFNPKLGKLSVILYKEGMFFLELGKTGKVTGNVYTLRDGVLVPYKDKVVLSEAFAPKDRGIVNQNNITLDDYLQTMS